MPAYSFKEQFIPLIKGGSKRQTIRKKRKGQAKAGDTLYLYYGMRTKYCFKIGEAICRETKEIIITKTGVLINGKAINSLQQRILALDDGFDSFKEMIAFWVSTHSLPFYGDIIFWKDFEPFAQTKTL